jgi:hypothetical protein
MGIVVVGCFFSNLMSAWIGSEHIVATEPSFNSDYSIDELSNPPDEFEVFLEHSAFRSY